MIVAESSTGETRYLLSDGLGSIRQAVDDTAQFVRYNEYDPYGNPISPSPHSPISPYGFTGEWWEDDIVLLHLRARWYLPETGMFVSRDPVESEPPYVYVRGNPVNRTDPSGYKPLRGGVGTDYVYSCNCGWIDWNHATPRNTLIKQIRAAQSGVFWAGGSHWTTIPVWSREGKKGITLGGVGGTVSVYRGLADGEMQWSVALGIFISHQNLFETYQGGNPFPLRALFENKWRRSSFTEEDLASNLIGFYRGLLNQDERFNFSTNPVANRTEGGTKQYFERVCKVIGIDEQGNKDSNFKDIQLEIYDRHEKSGFVYNASWGDPVLRWDWYNVCPTGKCKDPHVPPELHRISPKGSYPYQSREPTWYWNTVSVRFFGYGPAVKHIDPVAVSQAPLNWLADDRYTVPFPNRLPEIPYRLNLDTFGP